MLVALAVFTVAGIVLPIAARWLKRRVFYVAALVPAGVFVYTLLNAGPVFGQNPVAESWDWIPTLQVTVSVRMDMLSWVLALIVTGVGALVLMYCARYFGPKDFGIGRFAAVLLAFAGAMYGVVIADDVYLLFMFWEATSVFSYLLIGHYSDRRASRGAALQALLVTTAGGLAMLIGVVMLADQAHTTLMSEIVANPPGGTIVTVAIVLILVGAISKSALVPFHFWLPAAMAAPTPVSAYLHAAAMVKAGIYLIARLAPAFAFSPGWQPIVVGLGVTTMLVGAWRALKQHDLKLLLAYGTVSQLGFLTIVVGFGVRDVALAGLALLVAHALFKSTLFLVVGVIDRRTGTRDIRKLGSLGRRAPWLLVMSVLAVASMAGLPPTLGFVAKEGVFSALLAEASSGSTAGWIALVGVILGSVLTAAYSARFLWGAFAKKSDVAATELIGGRRSIMIAPFVLAVSGLLLGLGATMVDKGLGLYADTLPNGASTEAHLSLWHGFEPALGISALTLVLGLAMFWQREAVLRAQSRVPALVDAGHGYWALMRIIDRTAARTTAATQRGSLPVYLGIILVALLACVGLALGLNRSWPDAVVPWDHPAQVPIAVVMIVCAISATRAAKRFTAVVLLGITGYGLAALFALQGSPDLALTQVLVETVTLIAFVLVLRRLPINLGQKHGSAFRIWRAIIAVGVGALMGVVAFVALGARTAMPISLQFPVLAFEGGHGRNVVNVILVDIRSWDTMGEISVLVVAATGVASLIFIKRRTGAAPRLSEDTGRRGLRARLRPLTEPVRHTDPVRHTSPATDNGDTPEARRTWLLAGWTLEPRNRSIVLEVVVRLLFHSAIVVSIYLLFAGHNLPGGGFSGGLLAGLALIARYLAGGRYELGAAAPADAGKILGLGLILAVGTATVPLLFGMEPLRSSWFEATVPGLGHIEIGTSTIFDIGVYVVVIGLILDVLRSLGAEVDRQQEEESIGDATGPIQVLSERSTR